MLNVLGLPLSVDYAKMMAAFTTCILHLMQNLWYSAQPETVRVRSGHAVASGGVGGDESARHLLRSVLFGMC